MLFDPDYPHVELVKQEFRAYDVETLSMMDLGEHYSEISKALKSAKSKKEEEMAYSLTDNIALDIVMFIKNARRNVLLSKFITKVSHV